MVFPLTLKQTRATRAFTEIQPKIKKIQAEFKDDPQEMQKRLMATQKEAGATPGGCLLPLLVQMPMVCLAGIGLHEVWSRAELAALRVGVLTGVLFLMLATD